jgi:succinate-semialdehyde dehydrogenase/glutarate-semialdehyde dehydrogenase
MERMYVHEAVFDDFVAAFIPRVAALRMVPEVGWAGDMGSLTSQRQLDMVVNHVGDAVAKGATVLTGGRARPDIGPFYFEPTVLTGTTDAMSLCAEETFGPVVSLYPVSSDEEAVRRSNDTVYGLNAAVITRDTAMGRTIAATLRAGTVNINEAYGSAWGSTRSPMGGMGDSGLGRRHGDEGLLKYTESQTIATQRVIGFGAPFGLSDERWMGTMAVALGAMKRLGLK